MTFASIGVPAGTDFADLNLTGNETFDIVGLTNDLRAGQPVTVRVHGEDGSTREIQTTARIDSAIEVEYYRHGGVLQMVLRRLLQTHT